MFEGLRETNAEVDRRRWIGTNVELARVRAWPGPAHKIDNGRCGLHFSHLASQVVHPVVHEPTAALEQVGAHVGGLDRVPDYMGQGRLDDFAGVVRLFGGPVPERRPEPMRHRRDPVLPEQPAHLLAAHLSAALADEHDRTPAAAQLPRRVENLQRAAAQRHTVRAQALHPARGDRPDALLPVDLAPYRPADLDAPRRCEHHELERQRVHLARLRRPDLLDGRPHLAVRQGLPVSDDMLLGAEHRQEPVARVVRSPVHGDGPFQHGADAVANDPGRRRVRVPDGCEDLEHVGARHLGDRHPPDPWEDVNLEAAIPVPRHCRVAPSGALLLDDALSGLGEGGNARRTPLLGQRIAARAGKLAVGQRLLPRLGEQDQLGVAESELTLAAPDHEPLNPTPGSGLLDVKVETVAIAVPAGRCRAHEGGREPLVGMAALGLA